MKRNKLKYSMFLVLAAALAVQTAGCGTENAAESASDISEIQENAESNFRADSDAAHLNTEKEKDAASGESLPGSTDSEDKNSISAGVSAESPSGEASGFLTPEETDAVPAGTVLQDARIDLSDPGKYFTSSEIVEGDAVYSRIYGKSWRENPDIALSGLRYLRMLIRNFDDSTETGEMIVNASIAEDVLSVFTQLYKDSYQIRKMRLVDDYWTGDGASTDEASMSDDNTSAFNYRMTTSGRSLSNHALGFAIDLNPLENPYIYTGSDGSVSVSPANATNIYAHAGSHVITEDDEACALFTSYGFTWGGSWNNPKDYQHFERK